MEPTVKNYYPALTGIRAIAAWMVFVHHFNFFSAATWGKSIHQFFGEMHVGVTIFFVLSGLLLTLNYYDKPLHEPHFFYNYFVKRFSKIYPAFFILLVANFIGLILIGKYNLHSLQSWKTFFGAALLLRGFIANFANDLMPQCWSLTVEECFYALCPFLLLLLRKNSRNFIFLPLTIIGVGLLLTSVFLQFPFHNLLKDYRFLFNFTFFGRCIEFFVGIWLGIYYKKSTRIKKDSAIFTITGITFIVICIYSISLFTTASFKGDHHPVGIVINNLMLPIFGISLLFWGLLTETNKITKCLSSPVMVLLGKSSYIFYLLCLGIFISFFATKISGNPILIFTFLNVLSIILYTILEHPINTYLKRKWLRI
jgi:peptidoglycan/LPS O-acetylase OafA/YrhL